MDKLLVGGSAVLWFVALFLPGFISIQVYGLLVPSERRDFSKDFYAAVAYSLLNFGVFLPVLYWFDSSGWLSQTLVFWIVVYVVLLAAPVFWPWALAKLMTSGKLPGVTRSPIPKPWDYFFAKREPVWVLAYLTDGSRVGGIYGIDSYASSFPHEEQIYLEKEWIIGEADEFLRVVPMSRGVLLHARDVVRLEFYS